MIHPQTELRFIGPEVGYGVFATARIPEGSITYVKDSLELEVSPTDYLLHSPEMQEAIEKYSYIDQRGYRIISWDFAKYVNHCCNCNTMSTGYGFEIAIRDIEPGEQITDEYGIFNLERDFELICGQAGCRRVVRPGDFETYYRDWDAKIVRSLSFLFQAPQPLLSLVDADTRRALDRYFQHPETYRSVYALKYQAGNGVQAAVAPGPGRR